MAILLVMFGHASGLGEGVSPIFSFLYSCSWIGVDLFFVLSGFLISKVLSESSKGPDFIHNFYLRRFLRICPLYYLLLIFYFFCLPWILDQLKFSDVHQTWFQALPWYATFLSNVYAFKNNAFGHDPFAVSWSVSIEMQFYLIAPWLFLFLRNMTKKWPQCDVFCLLFLAGFSSICRFFFVMDGMNDFQLYIIPICRMEPILMGMLLYVLDPQDTSHAPIFQRLQFLSLICIPLIVLPNILRPVGFSATVLEQMIYYPAISIIFGSLLIVALEPKKRALQTLFEARWLQKLGLWSYGIYLTHNSINHGLELFGLTYGVVGYNLAGQILHYAAVFLLSTAAGALCYYTVERPMQRSRSLLRGARKTDPKT